MSDNPLSAALESVRSQLIPLTDALIAQLEAEADPQSAEWFVHVRYNLERAQSEEDLIMIFIEQLGPTAPLANLAGFTPIARLRLDQLLAKAQEEWYGYTFVGLNPKTALAAFFSVIVYGRFIQTNAISMFFNCLISGISSVSPEI